MISVKYVQTMVTYNREMNARIYASCAKLTEDQRKRDVGAFFKSIHGTLNHLLLGDRVWLGRFVGDPFLFQSLDQELYGDFSTLQYERIVTDSAIDAWAASLTETSLAGDLTYVIRSSPQPQRKPLWFVVTHFFNHQTHHRGQVTALLKQQGVDPGVTDLITFPQSN
jgi:uncharacterized damage-inducible protein DinB